jgi:hypothetical protein
MGSKSVDVTIVATLRPEIVRRTLESLNDKVVGDFEMYAVLNVDPVPIDESVMNGVTATRVVDEVLVEIELRAFFMPSTPSFAAAVKRVWSYSRAPYVLHLEDDWEFVREIDLDKCIEMLDGGEADQVRFSKRKQPIPEEAEKPGLLPGLWKGDTVRALSRYMQTDRDPEKQLRRGQGNRALEALLPQKIVDYPGGLCVRDIGREWRDERGLKKWDKNNPGDITWQK